MSQNARAGLAQLGSETKSKFELGLAQAQTRFEFAIAEPPPTSLENVQKSKLTAILLYTLEGGGPPQKMYKSPKATQGLNYTRVKVVAHTVTGVEGRFQ